jgi:hypothetical protein
VCCRGARPSLAAKLPPRRKVAIGGANASIGGGGDRSHPRHALKTLRHVIVLPESPQSLVEASQPPGRSRRSSRSCAATLSRPPPSPPSTSAWDENLENFARHPLEEPFAYLIIDVRYEKMGEGGVVMSQAALIAVGIDWNGRRQILAVEMANGERRSSWKAFLLTLK